MQNFKNLPKFVLAALIMCCLPLALFAQGGPHHGGGNHHHGGGPGGGWGDGDTTDVYTPPTVDEVFAHLLEEGLADCLSGVDATAFATVADLFDYVQANCDLGGPGGGGWGDDDSTDVDTPPTVGEVFAHLLEEGLADCLSGVDSTSFATIEELFAYVQANCALPVDTLEGPHHGHGHGGCHADSLDLDMPTVGEVYAHLLEEGLADCLSGVDSTTFATVADLFAYVQANCDLPADTTAGPGGPHHGPHHGHHGHHGHKVAAAQQTTSGKTGLGAAVGVTLSPNPLRGQQLTINATEAIAQCRVFDMSGKLLMSQAANGSQTLQINLPNLPGGVYLIQIQTTGGAVSSQKVVVE
ncbi:T9SS C-terminal target domain-containing protein [Sphingobacteriales bacterium UPWRP_1]|nr:hypothetical protein B6N25_10805 [Sphingobacteriales bacterium TSM_CSS]PSJ75630.1 T9SS C-terminal target domain-containing protein [Sphingobacteriales bacterium UPWRP_1]